MRALAKLGHRVRVAAPSEPGGFLQPLGQGGQIHAVQANVRHPSSVEAAARDADVVINLVGILFERGRQKFDAVQSFGAETVALAATAVGARMIHVSAIGADERAPSQYARSKALGEKRVLSAAPSAVILRPSVLFGPEDDFFNKFAAIARFSPFLPLVGGGHTRFQPVFAGDVASAIVAAIEDRAREGQVYELGGPAVHSFKELLQFMLTTIERRRLLIPIPFAVAKFQAGFLQLLPSRSDARQVGAAWRRHRLRPNAKAARWRRSAPILSHNKLPSCPSYLWRTARPANSEGGGRQS